MRQFTRWKGPNIRKTDYRRCRARLAVAGLVILIWCAFAAYRCSPRDHHPLPVPAKEAAPVESIVSPEIRAIEWDGSNWA